MYTTCPKCGHDRQPTDTAPASECPACGLNFAKWMKQQFRADDRPPAEERPHPRATGAAAGFVGNLLSHLVAVEVRVEPVAFWSRLVLHLVLVVWGMAFILSDHTRVVAGAPDMSRVDFLMHPVNLVFHEAGHVLFRPFGEFMMVLGGSLGQLIMPAVVLVFFVWRHANPFGGVVALWWLGQSTMDLAVYVHDAGPGRLTLLGGMTGQDAPGHHDWSRLLAWMGRLHEHAAIGSAVDRVGVLLMLTAMAWGAWLLLLQYRNLER